jgi:hypothetical protein
MQGRVALVTAGGGEVVIAGQRTPLVQGNAIQPQAYAPAWSIVPSSPAQNLNTSGLGGTSVVGLTGSNPWSFTGSPVLLLIGFLVVGFLGFHYLHHYRDQ